MLKMVEGGELDSDLILHTEISSMDLRSKLKILKLLEENMEKIS